MDEPRFFIDHGMIHDRETGKHVTTEPDSPFCDGIEACCTLLNKLVTKNRGTFPILVSSEQLARQIASDPDIETDNKEIMK